MNKKELVRAVSSQIKGQTVKSISEVLNVLIKEIQEQLREGNKVSIMRFATFENRLFKARSGEFNGVKWQTEDRLLPIARLTPKFKEEVTKNGR